MARRATKQKGSTGKLTCGDPVLVKVPASEAIETRIREIVSIDTHTEYTALLFLQSWWCNRYTRPLKDPILQEYTFEELMYEYYDYTVREEARKNNIDKQADIIEEEKEKETLDWVAEEERKELEAEKAKEQAKSAEPSAEDKEWMRKQAEEQLKINKELYGDDYGEDLSINFDE